MCYSFVTMTNDTVERVIELASAIKRLRADLTEKEVELSRLVNPKSLINIEQPRGGPSVLAKVQSTFATLPQDATTTANELSNSLGVKKTLINDALSRLARSNEISRVSVGVYKKRGGED